MFSEKAREEWIRRVQAGVSLRYGSKGAKEDKDVALAAVNRDGLELAYVSDFLKRDVEVVTLALRQNFLALEYVDSDLQFQIIENGLSSLQEIDLDSFLHDFAFENDVDLDCDSKVNVKRVKQIFILSLLFVIIQSLTKAFFFEKMIVFKEGMTVLQERLLLTPKDILEKEFKIDTRGYRPQEVDKFLDEVISDYDEMISMIKELEREKKDLIDENIRLKQEVRNARTKLDVLRNAAPVEVSNADLLRRLSNLEKIIYGETGK